MTLNNTAIMIKPVKVLESMITDSDFPEPQPEYPVYSPATPYSKDDTVSVIAGYHRRYRCVTANTGDFPPDNLTNNQTGNQSWVDIGATDKFAPFDEIIANQGTGGTFYEFTMGVRINSIAILNVDADAVRVQATTATGGHLYDYDQTINTKGYRGGGWANFLRSGERRPVKTANFFGLPWFADTVITVTFTNLIGVGLIVPGNQFVIGGTHAKIRPRIKSFSVKEFDTDFGYPILVPRLPAVRLAAVVQIDSNRQDIVFNTLKEFEAKPAVFIFGVYSIATTYGWLKDFSPVLEPKQVASAPAQIKIEGYQ